MIDPLNWNWSAITSTFVSAGAGTAFFAWLRDHSQTKRRAGYLALEIVLVLEDFADRCVVLIYENKNAQHRPDEQFPDWNASLPLLGELPSDPEGWRNLPRSAITSIRSLPARIAESKSLIRSIIEYSEDDIDVHVQEEAALRGLDALDAATALRRRYSLGCRLTGLGHEGVLLAALLESRAEHGRRREANRKSWERMQEMSSELIRAGEGEARNIS
jgi:hypothetical protein